MFKKRGSARAIWGLMAAGLAGLLVWPGGAWAAAGAAGAKAGAKVRVELKSAGGEAAGGGAAAGEVAGELVGVRKDAVVVGLESGESREIAVADIARIRVVRRKATGLGLIIGAVAGGVGGGALAAGKAEPEDSFLDKLSPVAAIGAAGALLGGGLGAMIGSQFGGDKTYDLANMSGAEVEKLMAKLSKAARVKDYQ